MGKICLVKSCPNGRKGRGNDRPLSVSFFKPTTPAKLKNWKQSLGIELKHTDFICHLHFKEEHIKLYEKFCVNGELKMLPKGRKMLREEAIPTIEHQFIPVPECELQKCLIDPFQKQSSSSNHFKDDVHANHEPEELFVHPEIIIDEQGDQDFEEEQDVLKEYRETQDVSQSFDNILNNLTTLSILPPLWTYLKTQDEVEFMRIDITSKKVVNHIRLNKDLTITVIFANNEELPLKDKISSLGEITNYLKSIEKWPICIGTQIDGNRFSKICKGVVVSEDVYKRNKSTRCKACRILRHRLQERHSTSSILKKRIAQKRRGVNLTKQCKRLKRMKIQQKQKLFLAKVQCSKKPIAFVQEAISKLPAELQNIVTSCFEASKKKSTKGRRYTLEWIYECLLIRLKSRNTYQFIRHRNILPLPCLETLNKYVRKISCSAYGFQPTTFHCLKQRCESMDMADKRGVILVDEMKLSEGVYFDPQSMKFNGFVDLGQHTPDNLKNSTADHALVFKFVPFRGRWVQTLGCFLSQHSCKSEPLHKLVLECIVLMENSGICVDAVVMDGAPWNRGVWKIFGIDEYSISCEHPCSRSRRLWMISDFNHLLKCFRTSTLGEKVPEFKTPYGIVKKQHWEAVLEEENYRQPNMKIAYKLTPTHLNPKGFQTMNVPLATEVFGHEVSVAMAHYQSTSEKLKDSTPTQKFISLIFNLIQAMSSRIPRDALHVSDDCRQKRAIRDFLQFLDDWENLERKVPISKSTLVGFKVTLRATLEILDMLHIECNYEFLMTATLSQDPLERFFSVMRNSCGGNDHPDPKMFAQVYRLASCFSLVRPPKGCNVSGTNLLKNLMEAKDVFNMSSSDTNRELWLQNIDAMLETSEPLTEYSSKDDHNYNEAVTSDAIQSYVAGYMVRKLRKTVKCCNCLENLQMKVGDGKKLERNDVINKMDLYGGLLYASDELFALTKQLEKCVLVAISQALPNIQTISQIFEELKKQKLQTVGCSEHYKELTLKIIDIYIVMRAHFLANSENKRYAASKMKTKMNRKNAKLLS